MKDFIQIARRSLGMVLLFSTGVHADTLVLKNGQAITAKSFVRQGDMIIASSGSDGEPLASGTGTPLTEIAKVECDQPTVLKNAPGMLAAGKGSAVLENIQRALNKAETFGLLPGSYWADLFVLQAQILLVAGKDEEAAKLATAMEKTKNSDLLRDSQALRALIASRKGDTGAAETLLKNIGSDGARPSTQAAAAVARGLADLEKKEFEEALKSFLELPVFLPDETVLLGIAQLGSAKAYYDMEDYDRAIGTLEDLAKTLSGTPEVSIAQSLLPEWKRRRTAVQDAKEH